MGRSAVRAPRRRSIITGFHRSGTSMTAQAAQRCGLALGPVLMPAGPSNPDGHFEDWDVVELHEQILSEAGSYWLHTGSLPPVRERHFAAMRRIAAQRDERHEVWGFKDPRACLFLDAWRAVIPDVTVLGLVRHWSLCLESLRDRHAAEIALEPALAREHLRLWLEPRRALASWAVHNRALLDQARRAPSRVHLLRHEDALEPRLLLAALSRLPGLRCESLENLGVRIGLARPRAPLPTWVPADLVASLEALWAEVVDVARSPSNSRANSAGTVYRPSVDEVPPPAKLESESPREVAAIPLEELIAAAENRLASRDLDEAERLARECVLRDPWMGEHHVRLGTCLLQKGSIPDAEISVLRGIALGPQRPFFWARLAAVCQQALRFDEARRHLDRAIQMNRGQVWFWIQLSELEQRAGSHSASVDAARTAAELDATSVAARIRLHDALIRSGRTSEAAEVLAGARARFPDNDHLALRETRLSWLTGDRGDARRRHRERMIANLALVEKGLAADPALQIGDEGQRADLRARLAKIREAPGAPSPPSDAR